MEKREKYVYITLSIIALLLFSLMNYIKGGSFDFDETFSLAMIDHSFSEIWAITARDYHPPLSYFILKVLSWVVKPFSANNLEIYRATAVLGYYGAILLCIFPIRRIFGFRVSVITISLIILMPVSFYIYSNFRMYAWTMPLVLASFVYAIDTYQNNNWWSWIKLTFVASAAMYIHYYSLISTFVIYVFLCAVILFGKNKEKRSLIVSYLISGTVLVLLYAPWLYFFVGQLAEVKSDYWIENPSISDLVFAVQYYFVPKYYTEKYINLLASNTWMVVIVPIMLFLVLAIVIKAYKGVKGWMKSDCYQLSVSVLAFSVLLLSLGLVMIYTFTVSPVYHIRYLMCYFGLFVFGLSLCISSLLENKSTCNSILVLMFSFALFFDFGLCVYMNIVRSNFTLDKAFAINKANDTVVRDYYCDETSFTEMAYLTVLHPDHRYYLVTDDNPDTRLITPPYIEGDTISGSPFTNFQKVTNLPSNSNFLYMTKNNPQLDSAFSTKYQVVDSIYSGLYMVEPIIR